MPNGVVSLYRRAAGEVSYWLSMTAPLYAGPTLATDHASSLSSPSVTPWIAYRPRVEALLSPLYTPSPSSSLDTMVPPERIDPPSYTAGKKVLEKGSGAGYEQSGKRKEKLQDAVIDEYICAKCGAEGGSSKVLAGLTKSEARKAVPQPCSCAYTGQ